MLPSTWSTWARLPSSRAQWSSTQRIFWGGSSRRDVTRTGRRRTWNAASATRAARLADRTEAKVAIARTKVPKAVASVATVVQSWADTLAGYDASAPARRPTNTALRALEQADRLRRMISHVSIQCANVEASAGFFDA